MSTASTPFEEPLVVDAQTAGRLWAILAAEIGAEPEWQQMVVARLVEGAMPVPFSALDASGARRVEILESWPPRLRLAHDPEPGQEADQAYWQRCNGQRRANRRIAALYGFVEEAWAKGHAFARHGNLRDPKEHCHRCGISYEHWHEGRFEGLQAYLEHCPLPAGSQLFAGHDFDPYRRDEVGIWLQGRCSHCELDYRDWLTGGCTTCALVPIVPQSRSRLSPLATRS